MAANPNLIEITLRSRQFWAGIVAISVLSALLYINISRQQEQFHQHQFSERYDTLLSLTSSYASPFLQTNNIISLNLLLRELTDRPEIAFGQITNSSGETLTELGNLRGNGPELNQAINFQSELVGYLKIRLENNQHSESYGAMFTLFTALIAIGWGLYCMKTTQDNLTQWQESQQQLAPLGRFSASNPKQLTTELIEHKPSLSIVRQLKNRMSATQFNLLGQQPEDIHSQIHSLVLVHCAPVSTRLDALENQTIHHKLQLWLDQVAYIYHGQRIDNGSTLAFGLEGNEEVATNALFAARVLEYLCNKETRCAISISSGDVWIGPGLTPWPTTRIHGLAYNDLMQIYLNNDGEQILAAESVFQHPELGDRMNASIYKDLMRANGDRLEVWQIDQLKDQYDALLRSQADRLPEMIAS